MSDPDILTRLDDCITFTTEHRMDGLTTALNDARDEIKALRSFAEGCRGAAGQIRAEALEEAARLCDEIQREVECQTLSAGRPFIDPEAAWRCAAAIRALKDERHE